jgi:DNA replication and repair protein RecF
VRVDWLSLTDFRTYRNLQWQPDPATNLLIGPNGAGKTNLLEAVGYLASLKSFRGAPEEALVMEEAERAFIRSSVAGMNRERLIEMELPRTGSRRVQVDKQRLRRAADMLGVIRAVAFLPDDIELVKRGPALRREMLDDLAVQLWPSSHLDLMEYDRAVRQRNAFLRSGHRDDVTLSVWDARVAQSGGKVLARRVRVMELLAPRLQEAHDQVAGSSRPVALGYLRSWDGARLEALSAAEYASHIEGALVRRRRVDYERKMTSVGPHRDEPFFSIGDAPARTHASQGEQRTIALSVRLASHRAIEEAVGEPPLLLLDDVFSELDASRSASLARCLPASTQTMITSARDDDLPVSGATWSVGNGTIV